jgi:hypothetical protein
LLPKLGKIGGPVDPMMLGKYDFGLLPELSVSMKELILIEAA